MKSRKEFDCFNRYFQALIEDFAVIRDMPALGQKEPVKLMGIYVSMNLIKKGEEAQKSFAGTAAAGASKERVLDPVQAIKNFHRLLILGAAGSGKTTLLRHLALKYCRENLRTQERVLVPIPIILREFVRSRKRLSAYIHGVFEKYGFPAAGKSVEKELESGKCLLLLDGFDELATRDHRDRAVQEISAFTEKYPGSRLVIVSRTTGYHDEMAGFDPLELLDFDQDQVKKFIDRWFGAADRWKGDALLKMLANHKDLDALVKNPLLLSTIACRYDEADEPGLLPKRVDLFQRVIDVLLDKWDAHKGVRNRFSAEQKMLVLRKLAFSNHSRTRRTMSEKEILAEITRHCPRLSIKKGESRLLLEEIWQRNYILRQLFMETFDFIHLSLQEYFAALELEEQAEGTAAIMPHVLESWWEGPILFYGGISQDVDGLIKGLREEISEDIFCSSLILAGKCIAEAKFIDPFLKEEIVQALWQVHKTGEFQLLQDKALAVLSALKPRSIINLLADQLTDKDLRVRRRAVETLGLLGSAEVLPALMMILVKDEETQLRADAALALGHIGIREAVFPLLRALNADKKAEVRSSAAEALGLLGCTEVLPALIKALTRDKDKEVRRGAAEALGKIGSAEAVSHLIQALAAEKDTSVRWRIAMSLGKLGGTDAHSVLIKALHNDRDKEVRESAAEGLGFIGGVESITALIKALTFDKDADVRGSAAYALGFIKSEDALPLLIKTLITDTNGEVRGRAAFALGRIKKIEALPYLMVIFNTHKQSMIRGNVTYALGEIGGVEALPFLVQVLNHDKDAYVRYRAADVLGGIGDAKAIEPLKNALKDEGSYYGWRVKDKAFEALDQISRRLQVRIERDQAHDPG